MPTKPIPHSNATVAVLSNAVVKSSYNLTVCEHRIIKTYLQNIKDYFDTPIEQTMVLSVADYAATWGLRMDNSRVELKKALLTLWRREVREVKPDGSYAYIRWCSAFSYDKGSDSFTIKWSDEIVAHISMLKERFTKLDLLEMRDFSSSYTFRLYEILICTGGENPHKRPSYEVEELMAMMDVPDSLKEYKIFKQRVLTPCVAELREKVGKFARLGMAEVKKRGSKKVVRVDFGWAAC